MPGPTVNRGRLVRRSVIEDFEMQVEDDQSLNVDGEGDDGSLLDVLDDPDGEAANDEGRVAGERSTRRSAT